MEVQNPRTQPSKYLSLPMLSPGALKSPSYIGRLFRVCCLHALYEPSRDTLQPCPHPFQPLPLRPLGPRTLTRGHPGSKPACLFPHVTLPESEEPIRYAIFTGVSWYVGPPAAPVLTLTFSPPLITNAVSSGGADQWQGSPTQPLRYVLLAPSADRALWLFCLEHIPINIA